jgi:hypothetical protein
MVAPKVRGSPHERIDLIVKARDGEALERRIEGDLEVALVGEILAPDLKGPLTIGAPMPMRAFKIP